jgi:hypothetical protein
MAEILIKGWKCDACNKEFYDGDCGVLDRSRVVIQSESTINNHSEDYKHVCGDCVEKILKVLYGTSEHQENSYNCSCYHPGYDVPRCWGTKNSEECRCNGNRKDCDFYTFDETGKQIGFK